MIDKSRSEESKDTPKEKEQEAIKALVTLSTLDTPTKILQKSSIKVVLLQISTPRSSSSNVDKVIHYADINLDEEIIIPKYDYDTMTIEEIGIL